MAVLDQTPDIRLSIAIDKIKGNILVFLGLNQPTNEIPTQLLNDLVEVRDELNDNEYYQNFFMLNDTKDTIQDLNNELSLGKRCDLEKVDNLLRYIQEDLDGELVFEKVGVRQRKRLPDKTQTETYYLHKGNLTIKRLINQHKDLEIELENVQKVVISVDQSSFMEIDIYLSDSIRIAKMHEYKKTSKVTITRDEKGYYTYEWSG